MTQMYLHLCKGQIRMHCYQSSVSYTHTHTDCIYGHKLQVCEGRELTAVMVTASVFAEGSCHSQAAGGEDGGEEDGGRRRGGD